MVFARGITICTRMAAGYTRADFLVPLGLSAFVRRSHATVARGPGISSWSRTSQIYSKLFAAACNRGSRR